jgi:hypothetical protein
MDLHDLVPRLVGDQAEAKVRTLGLPHLAAAALVAKECHLPQITDELRPHVQAAASARVVLWDEFGRRDLPHEDYRPARQRLHGRDLVDFRPGSSSGEPVVILDGVERSLREAVAEAMAPRKVQIAVPSGYVRPSRGTLATARALAEAAAKVTDKGLPDDPGKGPGGLQVPSKSVPATPAPDKPSQRHFKHR